MGGEAKAKRLGSAKRAGWIALLVSSLAHGQPASTGTPAVVLEGRAVRTPLRAGPRSEHIFTAHAGRTYTIELEQDGLDYILIVEDPAGESHEYNSPLLRDERELVLLENTLAGAYQISVRSDEHSGAPGSHSILVSALGSDDHVVAWRAMTQAAAAHRRGGEQGWAEAVAAYERAAEYWATAGERRNRAQALFSAAAIEYWQRSDWARSAELAGSAAALYAEIAEPVLSASALHLRAAALIEHATGAERSSPDGLPPLAEALFDEALALFRQARQTFDEHGRPYDAGLVVNNIGLTYYYMGEYRRAIAAWQEAASLFERLDEWGDELKALGNQAVIAAEEGHLVDAVAVLRRIVQIQPAHLHEERAATLDNLAASHQLLGNLDEALATYAEALALHRRTEHVKGEALSLRGIGTTYFALGYLELAAEFLGRALPLAQQAGDGRLHEAVLRALGNVAFLQGDHEAALELHGAALAAATAPVDAAGVEILMAKDLVALERYAEAHALAARARAAAEDAGARLLLANALQQSGRARIGLRQTDEAVAELRRAMALYRELAVPAGEAEALNGLALASAADGRFGDAVAHGEAALATIETLRSRVADPELRAYYAAARRDYYETQIEMLMERHRAADVATDAHLRAAFETSERSRARVTVDLIHEAATDAGAGDDVRRLAQRTRLIERLAELRHRRDRLLASPATPEAAQGVDAVVEQMAIVENELRVLETTLRRDRARYPAFAAPETRSLEDIQRALDADSVLLQYALGEKRSYVWIVTRDKVHAVELARRDALESAARSVYDALVDYRPDGRSRRALAAQLEALADAIVAPALPFIDGRRIVVASDGALQYVPFGALPDTRDGAGRNLLERYEIVSVPSMSAVLARFAESRARAYEKTLAVIADPVFEPSDARLALASADTDRAGGIVDAADAQDAGLEPRSALLDAPLARLPFSGREAAALAALLPPAERLVLTGVDANREAVAAAGLGRFRFVHFATHGLVDSQYPSLSGLALSSVDAHGARRNGFLRLDDIQALRLDAELVVLSACETALGREIRGEGLLGLTQAFMYAGARATAAGLWQVPDRATAELMSRFYEGMLARGLRPAEALRAAQLEIASERRWSDPYFWSAFVLMGDWR